ncbi:hypothetical protein R8G61_04340 [Tenacibaculum maritimum]
MYLCTYFLSSLKVTYSNLKFFNIIRTGKVIGVEYYNTLNADLKGTYTNVIIEDKTKDTIYGSTQKMYRVGDKVKFRYIGEQGGNVILKLIIILLVLNMTHGMYFLHLSYYFLVMYFSDLLKTGF